MKVASAEPHCRRMVHGTERGSCAFFWVAEGSKFSDQSASSCDHGPSLEQCTLSDADVGDVDSVAV
jgi:hypothetical protein